jgi:hypothetical protein
VASNAIQRVLESVLGSVLESILSTYFGVYSQGGWDCAIDSNWEGLWEHAKKCT